MHRSDLISICNGRAATAGLLIAVAILFVKAGTVLAEESDQTPTSGDSAAPREEGADQAEPPCPTTGTPDFDGCLKHRSYLTGDWGGLRPSLAERGITFDADVTQFYYGVKSGGLQQEFRYGGHGDYVVNADFGKLGVQEGLFLKLRAEDRFGESLSGATGAFLPQELAADLPVLNSENLYLTDVLVTQALSESFALFAGKMTHFRATHWRKHWQPIPMARRPTGFKRSRRTWARWTTCDGSSGIPFSGQSAEGISEQQRQEAFAGVWTSRTVYLKAGNRLDVTFPDDMSQGSRSIFSIG